MAAHESWKIYSEGGVWQEDVGLGGDLATAHGHTRWLGVWGVGNFFAARHARIQRSYWIGSDVEELARLPPNDHAIEKVFEAQRIATLGEARSQRRELVALVRGTQVTTLSFFCDFGGTLVERWW